MLFGIFLLKGCQWRYTASSYPNIRALEPTTVNPILLFAIDSLVLLFVILIQFLFKTLIYNRFFRNKLLQFVDVLSVANISVLIFDELCHGYYIHGRSVHGTSDLNMDELNHNLRKEEVNFVDSNLYSHRMTLFLKEDYKIQLIKHLRYFQIHPFELHLTRYTVWLHLVYFISNGEFNF